MRRSLAPALLLFSCAGCAAIFKGSHQDVQFESEPEGAKVENDGRYLGDTPAKASMDRLGSMNVRVTKPGYSESFGVIGRRPDAPWLVFDVATCVIPVLLCIPVLVDALSGAWMSLDDVYRVKLDAAPARPPTPAPSASSAAAPRSL